jgi:peptide/nickel transport system substrate-binding protein
MGRSDAAPLRRKRAPQEVGLNPLLQRQEKPKNEGSKDRLLRPSTRTIPCAMACVLVCAVMLWGCGRGRREAGEVVFVIDTNPANLDPRFATDGQSQRIVALIFDGLLERDAEMNLHGDLAESWETPDPLSYVFHLRPGVKFHDGRPLTAEDVKATFEYMMDAANRSPKRGAFRMVKSVEAPDAATVIFHLKEPAAAFPLNTIRGVVGIVPAGSGADFGKRLIGSGGFRFVSQAQDDSVVLQRNQEYFREKKFTDDSSQSTVSEEKTPREGDEGGAFRKNGGSTHGLGEVVGGVKAAASRRTPRIERVRFRIVPDAIVRALELRKGSADVEMSSLSPDMIPVLAKQKDLLVGERQGSNYGYLGINFEDSVLAHREVRQALAYATDRESLVKYLLRGEAQLASGILPPNHWAYEGEVRRYGYDPVQAEKLLDAGGFPRGSNGVRFHVTLKVSTQEQARLIGAVLQDQWKKVGVELEVRPLEAATLFADLAKGNFQLSYSNWVGANTDPDVLGLVFSSKRFPPDGANRGHYRNAKVDELTAAIAGEMDSEKRKALSSEVQKIVAEDVPYVSLWYVDVVSVHRKELGEIELTPTGEYGFLMQR